MTLCMSSVSIKMLQYEKIDASEEHVCNGCHGLLTMACSLKNIAILSTTGATFIDGY